MKYFENAGLYAEESATCKIAEISMSGYQATLENLNSARAKMIKIVFRFFKTHTTIFVIK